MVSLGRILGLERENIEIRTSRNEDHGGYIHNIEFRDIDSLRLSYPVFQGAIQENICGLERNPELLTVVSIGKRDIYSFFGKTVVNKWDFEFYGVPYSGKKVTIKKK